MGPAGMLAKLKSRCSWEAQPIKSRRNRTESESLKIVIENIVFGNVFLNAYLATVSWVNMSLSLDWNLVASLKIRVIFLQANKAHSSCGVCLSISKVDGHDESN